MREYGNLSVRFWTHGKGRQLRGDAVCLALAPYVFACPHGNMIGLFDLPAAYASADLGIPLEGASKGLQRLSEVGLVAIDEGSDAIFVFGAAKRNIGAELKPRDNRVKNVRDLLATLRKHPFYPAFLERYAVPYGLEDLASELEAEGASKGLVKGLRSQEQEQEQEQDTPQTPKGVGVRPSDDDLVPFAVAYRDVTGRTDVDPIPLSWSEHRKHLERAWHRCGGDVAEFARQLRELKAANGRFLSTRPLRAWVECLGVPAAGAAPSASRPGPAPVSAAADFEEELTF